MQYHEPICQTCMDMEQYKYWSCSQQVLTFGSCNDKQPLSEKSAMTMTAYEWWIGNTSTFALYYHSASSCPHALESHSLNVQSHRSITRHAYTCKIL